MSDERVFFVGPREDPDRYQLGNPAGAGAEGILYPASIKVSTGTTLDVAVKMLHPHHSRRLVEWAKRWRDQVELLRSLQVPGVVPVRDGFIGRLPHLAADAEPGTDETMYLVMNWIDGLPLDQWAETHSDITPAEKLRVLLPVAAALDLMHSGHATGGTPVIHGDIKPSNLLVTSAGDSVLVDFGLVRLLPDGQRPTGVTGTPGYLAPEVRRDGIYTPAADRYALGGIAYFLLTGEEPPTDGNPALLGARLGVAHPNRPELVEHVTKMLDPEPSGRPPVLANWCAQLRNSSIDAALPPEKLPPIATSRAPSAPAPKRSAPRRSPRRPKRFAALVGVLAIGAAVLVIPRITSSSTRASSAEQRRPVEVLGEHETRSTTTLVPASAQAPTPTASAPSCPNTYVGYRVDIPEGLTADPSSTLVGPCEAFSFLGRTPKPTPEGGVFLESPIVFASLQGTINQVLLRAENPPVAADTAIAGHIATIVEERAHPATGDEYVDTYLIDAGRYVLAAQLWNRPGDQNDYATARKQLDAIVGSLRFTSQHCLSSTDVRCGAFYYETDPAPNQRMVIDPPVVSPPQPHAGDTVTVTITVHDPDANVFTNTFAEWGDVAGEVEEKALPRTDDCSPLCHLVRDRTANGSVATGAWQPPTPAPGDHTFTLTHPYNSVGDYQARFGFRSNIVAPPPGQPDPYQSDNTCYATVTVR